MNCKFNNREQERFNQLTESLKNHPQNADAILALGKLIYTGCVEYDTAFEYLKKAVELDPYNVDALFWLAACYLFVYAYAEKSKRYLQRALAIEPNNAACLALMGAVTFSLTKDWKKDWVESLPYLHKAMELEPTWVLGQTFIAKRLYDNEQYETARKEALSALAKLDATKVDPRDCIEEYFHRVITGLGSSLSKKELLELLEKIDLAEKSALKKKN